MKSLTKKNEKKKSNPSSDLVPQEVYVLSDFFFWKIFYTDSFHVSVHVMPSDTGMEVSL